MGITSKIALAMASSAVGAAMLAGGSFALFTSQATNAGNTFAAGTVAVNATNNGAPAFVSATENFSNMAPGDSGTVNLTVKNTGTLGEWVKISNMNPSGLIFDATTTDINTTTGATANDEPLSLTPNANLTSGNTGYYLASGASTQIAINYSLPSSANNFYQAQKGTANITVEAVQAKNNTVDSSNALVAEGSNTAVGPQSWN